MLSLLLVSPLFAAGPMDGFSPDELKKIEKGEVAVRIELFNTASGKRAAKGHAFAIINKPPEAALAVLQDYTKLSEFMPRVEKATILQKTDTTMKVRQELGVAFTTVAYTLDLKFDVAGHRMDWTLDKAAKNDIADTMGSWEFVPLEGSRTLARYMVFADTGVSVPQFLEDFLVKKDLPNVVSAMKKRVESGGKWTK